MAAGGRTHGSVRLHTEESFTPGGLWLYDPASPVRTTKILTTFAICASIGVGAGFGLHYVMPESPYVKGLLVGDRYLPSRGSPEAWLAGRREAARGRIVRFRHEDHTFEATLDEVGVSVDVGATLLRAREVGHRGAFFEDVREARRAREGQIDVPLVWAINRERASAFFERVGQSIERPPVDARLDMSRREKIPDVAGVAIDVSGSIEELAAGDHREEETIPLRVRYVSAKTTVGDLGDVDIGKVVSAFETTFHTWGSGAGRAVNIRNAASKIDGVVVAPGAVFSFNETVGPRTKENGFTLAPEIQGDEMTPGIGGGTCQVSSTLHGAAVFGALDIIDRQSHSRISSYTKLGLDAAVSYPLVDLKIKNAMTFPIMIHAYLPKPTVVRVEILGGDPIATVEYNYGVSRHEDFWRRITVKPYMAPGRRHLHQRGTRGLDVTSWLKVRYYDGHVEEKHYFSGYRPFPEVYWVAPDYNLDELPPLPEHAKGVEGEATASAETSRYYPM